MTKYRLIYYIFSGILILGSVFVISYYGLNPGIDFTGGSIMEIEYLEERSDAGTIRERLEEFNLGNILIQETGENGFIIKTIELDERTHQEILSALGEDSQLEEKRFESIGPTIGRELRDRTFIVAILVLLSMIIYIAIAFSKVKRPVNSWVYGVISVFALFHDTLIPLAVFSILGYLYGVEITIPVITAFLAVLGYSINNTVVVFDRVRENLIKKNLSFEETIEESISQTIVRQINTSLTTLFVVLSIYFLGGETLKYFSLVLILGIVSGTYSSIFLAPNLLISWKRKSI